MFRFGPFLSRALRRPIQQRQQDGFLNAHHIGSAKQIEKYLENDRMKHFVKDGRGTMWCHPVMALDLGREVSTEFADKSNFLLYYYIIGTDPDPLTTMFHLPENRLSTVTFWDREKLVEDFTQDHIIMAQKNANDFNKRHMYVDELKAYRQAQTVN